MNLRTFVDSNESKYLVIGTNIWNTDPVAQAMAPDARSFTLNGVTYSIISLDPMGVDRLSIYIESNGGEYEFEFQQGNGKASYLLHSQMAELLRRVHAEEATVQDPS